jgi:hypothetical protein
MTARYRELDEITHWAINDGRTCLGVVDLVDGMFTARDDDGNVIGSSPACTKPLRLSTRQHQGRRAMAEHEPCIGETSEWFTPPEIFDALKLTFDLDPCSPGPGHWVPAKRIYTKEDDGLVQPWRGLTFMNPPFGGRNGHVPWLHKFFAHGNGVAIVRAYTSSAWWHKEMYKAELILFPRGKTKFIRPDGSIGKCPGHGIVLVGMGEVACEALRASGLGMVWDRRELARNAS